MFLTRQEIRERAGRLVVFGFAGKTLDAELKEMLREVQPLGLILFGRNIESPEQVCELNRELKSYRRGTHPDAGLLLCVDQEGGRVARVKKPATEWPAMRDFGQIGDAGLVRRFGAALAKEVRALNFDVDFAPVLDVDTNPKNPVIGERSLSRDAKVVARLGKAFIEGMQGEGIAACAKHFPGHGDTEVDSHLALPTVEHELRRMREVEWPPFAAAIEANVSSIMTAHVVAEAIVPQVPATLSPTILKKHLRAELGFKGIIVSDDIEMKAVADRYAPEDLAQLGLLAGIDVFLACRKPEVTLALYRGIVRAVEEEHISHQELHDLAVRAASWRNTYYRRPTDNRSMASIVGCGEHAALAQEVTSRVAKGA